MGRIIQVAKVAFVFPAAEADIISLSMLLRLRRITRHAGITTTAINRVGANVRALV